MSNLINQDELKDTFSTVLDDIGAVGYLRQYLKTIGNHTVSSMTPVDHETRYVSPKTEILQVVRNGVIVALNTRRIICKVPVDIDEIPPTYPGTSWTFIDGLGQEYAIAQITPTRPENTTIVFTINLVI